MNLPDLLINPDVIAAILGALIAFGLGIFSSNLLKRSTKRQITYSRRTEQLLILAKDELKEKLEIFYGGVEVENLYFFSLKIINTGKFSIHDQAFTCLFPEGTTSIDPMFPRITTVPAREVGPIERDLSVNTPSEYRYVVKLLGVGQSILIDFVTVGNPTSDWDIIFRPNEKQEVEFGEGEFTGDPTLEHHLITLVSAIVGYVVTVLICGFVPLVGYGLGAIVGLPFLLRASNSLKPVISAIAKRLQESRVKYAITSRSGQIGVIGDSCSVEGGIHFLEPSLQSTTTQTDNEIDSEESAQQAHAPDAATTQ